MRLPYGERSVIERRKLSQYCLSVTHPRGRHKARVFASALGLTDASVDILEKALSEAARSEECVPGEADQFGARYVLDFDLTGAAGTARVRSVWIVRSGEEFPRFVSCYVL